MPEEAEGAGTANRADRPFADRARLQGLGSLEGELFLRGGWKSERCAMNHPAIEKAGSKN